MKKSILCVLLCSMMILSVFSGCSKSKSNNVHTGENKEAEPGKQVTILVAAAASLKNCMEKDLKDIFEAENPGIKVNFTFDSSGKLMQQIEEGADADVFISAAEKQMKELNDKGFILPDSTIDLLENKIVLIVPESSNIQISSFKDILSAKMIALGDPKSVPAGQYAQEAFQNLGIWDKVQSKASYGTNVTEVLNWVAAASADAGVVYATDAASTKDVKVAAEAPEGSVSKVIYPAGIVKSTAKKDAASSFMKFLKTDKASEVFKKYGFTPKN